jgi:tetratricopeptide (TPR) repeat protein
MAPSLLISALLAAASSVAWATPPPGKPRKIPLRPPTCFQDPVCRDYARAECPNTETCHYAAERHFAAYKKAVENGDRDTALKEDILFTGNLSVAWDKWEKGKPRPDPNRPGNTLQGSVDALGWQMVSNGWNSHAYDFEDPIRGKINELLKALPNETSSERKSKVKEAVNEDREKKNEQSLTPPPLTQDPPPKDAEWKADAGPKEYSPAEVQQIEKTKPGDGYGAAAQAYFEAGDEQAAYDVLEAGLAKAPDNVRLRELRAKALAKAGRTAEAEAEARTILAKDPGNKLARVIVGHGDLSGGTKKALAGVGGFGPAGDAAGGKLGGPNMAGLSAAGPAEGAAGKTGPPGTATADGKSGARAGPAGGGPETWEPMAPAVQALLMTAYRKTQLKDWAAALVDLAQAIDLEPQNKTARLMRAETLNILGKHEAALKDTEEVLRLDPENARALRAKAYALLGLGRHQEAYESAKKATELEPDNGLGWLYRAMAEEKLGKTDEAIAHYKKAAALDASLEPAVEEALKRLGAGGKAAPVDARKLAARFGLPLLAVLLLVLGLKGGKEAITTAGRLFGGKVKPASQDETVAARALSPGFFLGGHFKIVRELGRGGMGIVYEAEDQALQRRVAIKQLQGGARGSEDVLRRFLSEARLAAKLRHPGLAEILTVIEDSDVFLVFEYLEGETLDEHLTRRGPLAPAEARRVLAEICGALDFAHERKVIHRDLKPSNVMVLPQGACKVMDLGIAHESSSMKTTQTAAAGTPPYMAPEQMMGSVSRASDIYALGIIAYELLCGSRPFSGPDFLGEKLEPRIPPITTRRSALPGRLDVFFSRVLAPDPRQRPQSAAEFLRELDAAIG